MQPGGHLRGYVANTDTVKVHSHRRIVVRVAHFWDQLQPYQTAALCIVSKCLAVVVETHDPGPVGASVTEIAEVVRTAFLRR